MTAYKNFNMIIKMGISLFSVLMLTACGENNSQDPTSQDLPELTHFSEVKNWCNSGEDTMFTTETLSCECKDISKGIKVSKTGVLSCQTSLQLNDPTLSPEFEVRDYNSGNRLAVTNVPTDSKFNRSYSMIISSSYSQNEYQMMREHLDSPWAYQSKYNSYSAILSNFAHGVFVATSNSVKWLEERAILKGNCIKFCKILIPNKDEIYNREIHYIGGIKVLDQAIDRKDKRYQLHSQQGRHSIFIKEITSSEKKDYGTKLIEFSLEKENYLFQSITTDRWNNTKKYNLDSKHLDYMNEIIRSTLN